MKRIHNTKYNICISNHRKTRWIIPANEGYFVPLILINYLDQQGLASPLLLIEQENQGNIKEETTTFVESRDVCDVNIQLYYPKSLFSEFCSWLQIGTISPGSLQHENLRFVYPTLMKWCGIPVDLFFYSGFKEPIWDENEKKGLQSLVSIVNKSIGLLQQLRPNAKGYVPDRRWVQETQFTAPLVRMYAEILIKSLPANSGQIGSSSTSLLHKIPSIETISLDFTGLYNFESFFIISKQIVELERALEDRKILLTSTSPTIPNWMQLFIDTIALTKNISGEDARYRGVEAFDMTEEFWNDVEMHVGISLWEQVKVYHHEQKKRRRQEFKTYVEQFLDVYPSEFDQEMKAKMITRVNWAIQVVQHLESIETC